MSLSDLLIANCNVFYTFLSLKSIRQKKKLKKKKREKKPLKDSISVDIKTERKYFI